MDPRGCFADSQSMENRCIVLGLDTEGRGRLTGWIPPSQDDERTGRWLESETRAVTAAKKGVPSHTASEWEVHCDAAIVGSAGVVKRWRRRAGQLSHTHTRTDQIMSWKGGGGVDRSLQGLSWTTHPGSLAFWDCAVWRVGKEQMAAVRPGGRVPCETRWG